MCNTQKVWPKHSLTAFHRSGFKSFGIAGSESGMPEVEFSKKSLSKKLRQLRLSVTDSQRLFIVRTPNLGAALSIAINCLSFSWTSDAFTERCSVNNSVRGDLPSRVI